MGPDSSQHTGFGLYLHWPFCQAKCPYCDFNSHVSGSIDQAIWETAFLDELDRVAKETSDRRLDTVFFGGGTPSLMDPWLVESIMDRVRRNWSVANDFEVTMEANPTSVEAAQFQSFRQAGVDRVSLGIQALNDRDLKRLGRMHSADEARRALDIAQTNFDRVSFDLIYARQDQTSKEWEAELSEALGFGTGHMSLYQLTIEEGTVFGARHARGLLAGLPEDDTAVEMFDLTQARTDAAGLSAYEVSNHAVIGQEARHNLIYWRGGDYLGIGPGAHGRLTLNNRRYATETKLAPSAWLADVKSGNGEAVRNELNVADQDTEYLLMSLRTREGCTLSRLTEPTATIVASNRKGLVDEGLLVESQGQITVPRDKWIVLNAILAELLT